MLIYLVALWEAEGVGGGAVVGEGGWVVVVLGEYWLCLEHLLHRLLPHFHHRAGSAPAETKRR